jgi:hypothetical protein
VVVLEAPAKRDASRVDVSVALVQQLPSMTGSAPIAAAAAANLARYSVQVPSPPASAAV